MNFLICVAVFVSLRLDSDRDFVYIYINLHGSLEASACTYFNNVVRYFFFSFGFWFLLISIFARSSFPLSPNLHVCIDCSGVCNSVFRYFVIWTIWTNNFSIHFNWCLFFRLSLFYPIRLLREEKKCLRISLWVKIFNLFAVFVVYRVFFVFKLCQFVIG